MTTRPGRTTIDLGPDGQRHKDSLRALAEALGFDGNVSELMRWLAEVYSGAARETVLLLKAAGDWAGGGDEWNTLAILHEILPEFTLVAGSQTVTVDEIAAAVIVGLPNDE